MTFHPDYQPKFPEPEAQIVPFKGAYPASTREYSDRLIEARRYLEAVIDAQKRFADLAEAIDEKQLEIDDPHVKLALAALSAAADNGRRAMEEARKQ